MYCNYDSHNDNRKVMWIIAVCSTLARLFMWPKYTSLFYLYVHLEDAFNFIYTLFTFQLKELRKICTSIGISTTGLALMDLQNILFQKLKDSSTYKKAFGSIYGSSGNQCTFHPSLQTCMHTCMHAYMHARECISVNMCIDELRYWIISLLKNVVPIMFNFHKKFR